ncbi:MAG: hypothetical protein JXR63_00985 [Spirochaetales bacterium]|nr:hypothetical protein [Spirochaetales bacterium]
MKKRAFLITLLLASVLSVHAQGSDFSFYLGGAVLYENPLIAGGNYNEDFAAKDKPVNIDDFLLGLMLRTDWTWGKVGLRLDLQAFYNPTADYLALGDAITQSIEDLDAAALEAMEHGMRFVFNPMFHATGEFVSFSFGPGVVFGWNISQGIGAMNALESGDASQVDHFLERIGMDPLAYTITTKDELNAELNWLKRTAFYGGELDFNLKVGLDFNIGKIVFGINYIWDMNSKIGAWDDNADFATNMGNVIKLEETVGYLGGYVLYKF